LLAFRRSPFLKALLVYILTTSGPAPYDPLATLDLHFTKANRAVTLNWLAGLSSAALATGIPAHVGTWRRIGKDFLELGAQEGELVDVLKLGPENPCQDIELMLALVSFPPVRAVACWLASDMDLVDITG